MAAPQQLTVIAKVLQPQRSSSVSSQPASFIIVDDQQPGPSRQVMFVLSPTKIFYLPSIASGQQEDSQHNTSGLSSLFGSISGILPVPADRHTTTIFTLSTSTSTVSSANYHSARTSKTSQLVQPAESAQISRLACIKSHQQ